MVLSLTNSVLGHSGLEVAGYLMPRLLVAVAAATVVTGLMNAAGERLAADFVRAHRQTRIQFGPFVG
jgi:hypothetical protein